MLTTIHIAGLETYAYHGVFEEERRLGQTFTFDIDATLRPTPTHRDDELNASVRYDAMTEVAIKLASRTRYQTLEALGEAIACALMQRFASIDSVSVGVFKTRPPIPHTLGRIGVKVHLTRAELNQLDCADEQEVTPGSVES